MENIRVRLAPGIYGRILRAVSNANSTGGIKPSDNAAFGAQPQGYGVANRLAAEADCRRFQPAGVVLVQKFYSPSRRVRDENF
jgi:hypothetical protein